MKVAGYGRVSTVHQAEDGTSSDEQKRIIHEECQRKGWRLIDFYSDDGFSGKNTNRPGFSQMLADAKKGKFKVCMFTKLDRVARKVIDLLNSLQVLNELGVKIYCVEQTVINTEGPMGNLTLQILAAFAEFERTLILERTNNGKRSRAKQGHPSSGNLPFARTFNKETVTWHIVPKLKEQVEQMANDYLYNNFSFEQLGEKYKMAKSYIRTILLKRSGDKFEQHFENETITTTIPRLLSDDIIEAIKRKSQSRKIVDHGAYKHQYLLSRFIYDAKTGYALTGTPSKGGILYYRTWKKAENPYMVRAELIENAVMDDLFEALSNNDAIYKAVFGGEREQNLEEDLRKRRSQIQKEYASVQTRLSRFGDAIGDYEGDDVKAFLSSLKPKIVAAEKKLKELENEMHLIDGQLSALPTKQEIKTAREIMRKQLEKAMDMSAFTSGHTLHNLSFQDKRALLKLLFAGKDASNKKYGIYVTLISDNPRKFLFTAYGRLGNLQGLVTRDSYDSDAMNTINDDTIAENISHIINDVDFTDKSIFSLSAQRVRRGVSEGLAGRVPTQWVAATQAPVIDVPQKHNLLWHLFCYNMHS